MDAHAHRLTPIASSVRAYHATRQKFRINHGSSNSTRSGALKGHQHNTVDTSALKHVISVDAERMLAVVEPNVPMDRLVEATLAHGCVPGVVMEFPGITAGGGYAGTACESSSFKHGYFDRTTRRLEMVLPNGEVVSCSATEHEDLFHGAAGALGTLGVVTLVEVRLEPARRYVETTYHPVCGVREAVEKCRELTSGANYEALDYVDGILFSETSGAIITGRRTDEKPADASVSRFSGPRDPWFAFHVQERIEGHSEPITEYIPLPEYLFRYDRGGFWVGRSIYDATIIPFNPTFRALLDRFMHTRMLYAARNAAPINIQFIQDMAVPYESAVDFLKFAAERVKIWPIWLCPVQSSATPTLHPHLKGGSEGDAMLNLGIWGSPHVPTLEDHIETNQAVERKLEEVGGMKWMYGVNYQCEEDFWRQFDRQWYEGLRRKYHAEWMPTIFDKAATNPETLRKFARGLTLRDVWPFVFPGVVVTCLWRAWRTGAWRWKKESTWPSWVARQ
ncbi:FAD-binding domain-containing protein [Teratosphaeria nubilosa]|uniref:Delta(24)-sterol reductase n=1 Tax=Teratosphaeria nubilosa TaxID=161662 RepID=A0A6G1LNC5_9PEZI|nr:FAD-binding domain-containing protein [Teratosphaeria nubilosa]